MTATPYREPDPDDVRTGAHIRALREATGINQAELARRMRVTQAQVSHLESGRRRGEPATRLLLAEALEVPLGAIYGPESERRKALAAKLGIPAKSLEAAS